MRNNSNRLSSTSEKTLKVTMSLGMVLGLSSCFLSKSSGSVIADRFNAVDCSKKPVDQLDATVPIPVPRLHLEEKLTTEIEVNICNIAEYLGKKTLAFSRSSDSVSFNSPFHNESSTYYDWEDSTTESYGEIAFLTNSIRPSSLGALQSVMVGNELNGIDANVLIYNFNGTWYMRNQGTFYNPTNTSANSSPQIDTSDGNVFFNPSPASLEKLNNEVNVLGSEAKSEDH